MDAKPAAVGNATPPKQFGERRTYSRSQLAKWQSGLEAIEALKAFPDTCVYVTGSYARLEAGKHSDIDLFFLSNAEPTNANTNLNRICFFSEVISLGKQMGFPPFSNDGEYLKILSMDAMLSGLGGPKDDYENHFTARMLLMLESQPLVNAAAYEKTLGEIVDTYFRDYPDHATKFRPIFLINDILRFWKTLCLNYEHKRNRPDADIVQKRKQQVKNFKLKFSRMMTCFGTVVAICAQPAPVEPKVVLSLLKNPPLDRLLSVLEPRPELHDLRDRIVDQYGWFLDKTALTTEEITKLFDDRETKSDMFRRGDAFGALVFEILKRVSSDDDYLRYMVI